ncbi:hypothetical protein [Halorubrum lipolyticum]|uniref:Uncharacterized protein n=1 Tax=Halorubrum lipolyticum DSM 21995 TaxID=1227482 RepID=M0NJ69_9EURY|nr:hypothetical protein [Halorubrum lipolyticum]EMA57149.1 hypothetical protein C469_15493 [Halorubrum lipolyticum DSM 21995]
MRNEATVVGAAPNIDLRGKRDTEPAADRWRHRIYEVTCISCGHSERIHVEPGETRFVEHDEQNAAHVVEYVEVGR